MEDIAAVEGFVQADFFLYNIDIVDGSVIGELAGRSVGKHANTVQQLQYKSHIFSISNINALLKAYRCPSCDEFMNKAGNLERDSTTCEEKVKHAVFTKHLYQLRETLFDKLNSFNINSYDDQKLLKNMAITDFESISLQEDKFRATNTTTWIGQPIPTTISFSSNLLEQPIF